MFQSRPEHYDINMKQAPSVHAKAAVLTPIGRDQEPAVVIFKTRQIQSVLPVADALRLANEIADSISAHNLTTN